MKKALIVFLFLSQICLLVADIVLAVWFVPFLLVLQVFIFGFLLKNYARLNLSNGVRTLASGLFVLFGAHLAWYLAAEFALKRNSFEPAVMWGIQAVYLVIAILTYLQITKKTMR